MEYNGDIRVNLKKLIEKIAQKNVSEDRVSHAVSQLKDCIDYMSLSMKSNYPLKVNKLSSLFFCKCN
jgi:hypothetical protein